MTGKMQIWDAVSETDPNHTKHVALRGGFTAIDANYQVMMATKQFGPVGIGWGYDTGTPIFHETLVMIPVTLWHGERANHFGPIWGCEEWKDGKGRVDSDATKKAETDALTKALSRLGFNADVFLGRFDDQKYVDELTKKYAPPAEPKPPIDPDAFINDKTRDRLAMLIDASGTDIAAFCKANSIMTLKELTNARAAELAAPLKKAA